VLLRIIRDEKSSVSAKSRPLILSVADFFHPIDDLAVERLLNGDVRHRSRRCGALPMFLVRRKPDDIANVTFAPQTRAGSVAWNNGSMRTFPVNQSGDP
jgi:hypothetical protein